MSGLQVIQNPNEPADTRESVDAPCRLSTTNEPSRGLCGLRWSQVVPGPGDSISVLWRSMEYIM